MPLDFRSPDTAWELVKEAIDLRREVTDAARPRLRRFSGGSAYRSGWSDAESVANEAHEFEWTSNIVPHLVFTNPSFTVRIPGAPPDMPIAREGRIGLNAWSHATDICRPLAEVAVDLQFTFGAMTVLLEPVPGGVEPGTVAGLDEAAGTPPALRPVAHRIPPSYFFVDPRGGSFNAARFMGHVWIEDAQTLKEQTKPDGTPLYEAATIDGIVDANVDEALQGIDDPVLSSLRERGEVVGVTVYCRDTGYLHTLAYGTGVELRPPRRYNGPKRGPYVLFGCWVYPDQVYPLSPLAVTDKIVEEINAHSLKLSQDAATAGRIVVVDAGNEQLARIVSPGNHGTVWNIPGVSPSSVTTIEFGGPDPKNMEHVAGLREKLDRTSGLSETVRGNITDATAEEVATAQQNRNVRVKFMQTMFKRGVSECARIALHHLLYNPDVGVDGEEVDEQTGEKMYMQVSGARPGTEAEDPITGEMYTRDGTEAERAVIDIEPYSMELVDEVVLQRTMEVAMQDVVANAPVMVQAPWLNWRNILSDRFETMNVQGGAERYIDFDMLKNAQMQANPALFMPPVIGPDGMPVPGVMMPPPGAGPMPMGGPPQPGPGPERPKTAGGQAVADRANVAANR